MVQITISKRAALIIGVALVLVIPGVAGATHIFTDVVDSNVHAPGIEWVANAGVTAGCGDGSTYCPNDPVSRAQMGTFMHRLSGNAPGIDPSVNADQVDGIDAADLLPRWALIAGDDGSIVAQSGGITAIRPVTGAYYLDFGEDLRGKGVSVSLVWRPSTSWGEISTSICGGPTDETVTCTWTGTNTNSNLWVNVRASDGLSNSDENFYVVVFP